MRVSIIIPTYNRQAELSDCLQAIADNSVQPDEVIIVEQGDATATEQVAAQFNLHTRVEYFTEKSAARARNKGVEVSSGDILLFVDDDVVLDADYIKIAKEYFDKNLKVLGIMGRDMVAAEQRGGLVKKIRTFIGWLFWRGSYQSHSRVLWSGHNVLKNQAEEELPAEWLLGVSCWRRRVFEEGFRYDHDYIRWCFGEDVTFSHQVYLKYSESLRYVPTLHFYHYHSAGNRLANPAVIKMAIIYRYLFWKRYVHQGKPWRTFAYVWSQVGFSILQLIETPSWTAIKTLAQTYWYVLRNRKKIMSGEIEYNSFILEI